MFGIYKTPGALETALRRAARKYVPGAPWLEWIVDASDTDVRLGIRSHFRDPEAGWTAADEGDAAEENSLRVARGMAMAMAEEILGRAAAPDRPWTDERYGIVATAPSGRCYAYTAPTTSIAWKFPEDHVG